MDREVLLTGIGGQGVQLAAHVLARVAVREGRQVLLLGTYGGTMRGGNTDSTLVVADGPVSSPPIVSSAWSAILMHHAFWEPTRAKLVPGAVVVVNAALFEGELDRGKLRVFDLDATSIAAEAGSPLSASLVLVGAYAAVTTLVGLESLVEAMRESVPAYRRQHLEGNEKALRAGFGAAPAAAASAWKEVARS